MLQVLFDARSDRGNPGHECMTAHLVLPVTLQPELLDYSFWTIAFGLQLLDYILLPPIFPAYALAIPSAISYILALF